jgi:hypothetical protein
MLKNCLFFLLLPAILLGCFTMTADAQTAIPNGDFENWVTHSNYSDPQYWSTPNSALMSILIFGKNVVYKSTDHYSGQYAAKLVTEHIALPVDPFDVPGFITLGTLTININNQTYTVTGGVPIPDQPTHMMGYYKFQPKGGDSCVIGIALFKTTAGVQDTIAYGYLTTKDTVNDWTHFSAWIDYRIQENPDTMNIIAVSSAQTPMTPGTTLYVDDLSLDYTVGFNEKDPAAGIAVYQDKETGRLIVFCDFPAEQNVNVNLYDLTGRDVFSAGPFGLTSGRVVVLCNGLSKGLYVLAVQHEGKTYIRKFLLGF